MDKKSLEKYLKPSPGILVIAVIVGGMGLFLLVGGLILPALIPLAAGGICGWVGWNQISQYKKYMENLEASGEINRVLQEFGSGKQFFKDKLRIGPTYILGKGAGKALKHNQVQKVYQHVHKTNFVEDGREMRVETNEGKLVILCKIPLRGKGDQELIQAISIMKTMNPGIHVGYK